MTEDEKRQQKAMVLLEYQEAQENLTHLREKVRRTAATIGELCKWLTDAQALPPVRMGYEFPEEKRNANIRANLGTFRAAMNFEEILALMDEVKRAETLLGQIEQRKNDFGLK